MGNIIAACGTGGLALGIIVGYLSTKLFSNTLLIIIACNVGGIGGALIIYYIITKLVLAGV
jgi:hypothetical protein